MLKLKIQCLLPVTFLCLVIFTECPGHDNNQDSIPPQVTCTLNANRATEVFVNSKIGAFFTEEMNSATFNASTFFVSQGTTPVAGTITYTGLGAIFAPAGYLAPHTTYTATITKGVMDLAGNSMASDFVWGWTTGSGADMTPPSVIHTVNPDGAEDVYINTQVIACFSKIMDPSTITASTFSFKRGMIPVPGKLTSLGFSLIFTAADNLVPDTAYTATITTGVRDYAGNALPAAYIWNWKTGTHMNESVPYVLHTTPGVIRGTTHGVLAISATFNEPIDPLRITTLNFIVKKEATPVTGIVLYNDKTMTANFIPIVDLESNTTYTCSLTNQIRNVAGNALTGNTSWSFTTSAPVVRIPAGPGKAAVSIAPALYPNTNTGSFVVNGYPGLSPGSAALTPG